MEKRTKLLSIIIPISFLMSGLTVLLCLLDNTLELYEYKIIFTVLLAIWAFFILPSIAFAIDWIKLNYKLSPHQSFIFGYIFGGLVFLILIVTAPISGILWFVKTIGSKYNR